MVIVNSENIDWTTVKDTVELQKCTEQGIHLVFANLPDVSVIKRIRNSWNCLASKNYSRSGNGEGNGFVCESDAWRRKHL